MKIKLQKKLKPEDSFSNRVREVVRSIPKGQTLSYKEVARLAGSPGASRAVGNIMMHNYDLSVPCHRVIKTNGKLGCYNRGGPEAKRKLLEAERATL